MIAVAALVPIWFRELVRGALGQLELLVVLEYPSIALGLPLVPLVNLFTHEHNLFLVLALADFL